MTPGTAQIVKEFENRIDLVNSFDIRKYPAIKMRLRIRSKLLATLSAKVADQVVTTIKIDIAEGYSDDEEFFEKVSELYAAMLLKLHSKLRDAGFENADEALIGSAAGMKLDF